MTFNMSPMTILKVTDPDKWKVEMQRAITKHLGVGLHIAQDFGIGISTLKRWIEADPSLAKRLAQTRRSAKSTKAA